MRQPSEIDDLHLDHAQPDPTWIGGEIELADERPTTALRGDTSHRKWMMIGLGGCGLLTAIAVVVLTHGEPQARAAEQAEPAPIDQPIEPAPVEPAVVATTPEPVAAPKKREKPTLAATSSRAATSKPVPNKAPPAPQPAVEPNGSSTGASKPATPSSPTPTPTSISDPAPSLPADAPAPSTPAAELPDVEPWDEADAAVEAEQAEPESVG